MALGKQHGTPPPHTETGRSGVNPKDVPPTEGALGEEIMLPANMHRSHNPSAHWLYVFELCALSSQLLVLKYCGPGD